MNQNLLQEVSLSIPAVTEPPQVTGSPNTYIPPVFTAPAVSVPSSVNVAATTQELESLGLHTEWVTGTALQKPYPGAPTPSVNKELNLRARGEDDKPESRNPLILLDQMLRKLHP